MFRNLTAFLLLICLAGCTALSSSVKPEGNEVRSPSASAPEVAQVSMTSETLLDIDSVPVGIGFGKTVFAGLLKTAYVRLTVISRNDPAKKYFFIIGDKANQSVVPWAEGRVIEPGYFYWELPVGSYEITAIAIPVGSTIAEESVALDFEMAFDRVNYLGTLDVNGTKERVKFGGLPVVQPGFEYELALHDDFEIAKKDFESLLPSHPALVVKGLLEVKSVDSVHEAQ
ncbi:MAG: hypothetical protein HQL21_01940 [Candidatus Omnitrophica bacterium]|nr:hypothetical protein [Candidatus Omnitrophota bacterium]